MYFLQPMLASKATLLGVMHRNKNELDWIKKESFISNQISNQISHWFKWYSIKRKLFTWSKRNFSYRTKSHHSPQLPVFISDTYLANITRVCMCVFSVPLSASELSLTEVRDKVPPVRRLDPGLMPLPDTASGLEWSSLVNAAKAYEGEICLGEEQTEHIRVCLTCSLKSPKFDPNRTRSCLCGLSTMTFFLRT